MDLFLQKGPRFSQCEYLDTIFLETDLDALEPRDLTAEQKLVFSSCKTLEIVEVIDGFDTDSAVEKLARDLRELNDVEVFLSDESD